MALNTRGLDDISRINQKYTTLLQGPRKKKSKKKKKKSIPIKSPSSKGKLDFLYDIGIDSGIASLLFIVFNSSTITNMYGKYLPGFWDSSSPTVSNMDMQDLDNGSGGGRGRGRGSGEGGGGKISIRGRLYQMVAIFILFFVLKLWLSSIKKK